MSISQKYPIESSTSQIQEEMTPRDNTGSTRSRDPRRANAAPSPPSPRPPRPLDDDGLFLHPSRVSAVDKAVPASQNIQLDREPKVSPGKRIHLADVVGRARADGEGEGRGGGETSRAQ